MISFENLMESVDVYLREGINLLEMKYNWFSNSIIEINDLRQESLIKLFLFWKAGGELSPSKSIKYFIFHLLENTAIDLVRNHLQQGKIKSRYYFEEYNKIMVKTFSEEGEIEFDLIDPTPYQNIIEIKEILNKLPEEEKKFLDLLCRKSEKEIMNIYGIKYDSYRQRVRILNRKLKILLESHS